MPYFPRKKAASGFSFCTCLKFGRPVGWRGWHEDSRPGESMNVHELRNLDEARRFLLQGLWLQRVLPPTPATVRSALEWCLEIASAGQPLPPPGFVADAGHVAFGMDWEAKADREDRPIHGVPPGLLRAYEDHVLGKLYVDWSFAEAGEYLRTYQGRDRPRGLAFVLNQFRERAGVAGVELSPGVIKQVLEAEPQEVLAEGWATLDRDGPQPLQEELLHALIASARRTAEVLGREDLFELKRRTALDELGQRLALRHVLQAANRLEDALPAHRVRPLAGRQEVPTRVLDEDTYPVGGFASLSTRGSIESLLHSQLAYMEKDDRPDLFDIKYLRDELLYYARDENQFLRRRRTFAFVLFPDLVHTRFKDAELPYQRVVLLWALLYVTVRKLSDWLSTDALTFVFTFVGKDDPAPLAPELALLRTLLQEQVDTGTVVIVEKATHEQAERDCALRARRSLCYCLPVATTDVAFAAADTAVTRLRVDRAYPALGSGDAEPAYPEVDDTFEGWEATLKYLLQLWV
jgi:hypothetical protein